jgi:hypothetical protein
MSTYHRRNSFVWPVILIGLGVVLLLNNLGVVNWDIWLLVGRLWPVVLIAVGVDILFGRRTAWGGLVSLIVLVGLFAGGAYLLSNSDSATTVTLFGDGRQELQTIEIEQALEGAEAAEVSIDFGIGELTLGSLDASLADLLIAGMVQVRESDELEERFDVRDGAAIYAIDSHVQETLRFPPFFNDNDDRRWDLSLNPAIPTELDLNMGVGQANLDLRELALTDLQFNGGVGRAVIILPESGDFTASIDGGVGEIELRIPAGMAARIHVDTGIGNTSVRGEYERAGDVWESEGFDQAENRVEIFVDNGIGSVIIVQVD